MGTSFDQSTGLARSISSGVMESGGISSRALKVWGSGRRFSPGSAGETSSRRLSGDIKSSSRVPAAGGRHGYSLFRNELLSKADGRLQKPAFISLIRYRSAAANGPPFPMK